MRTEGNERSWWVHVHLDGYEGASRFTWRVLGGSPEQVEQKLQTKYPQAKVHVVREAYEGERYLP